MCVFRLQKLFGRQLAAFKLKPLGFFSKKKGYKQLAVNEDSDQEMEVDGLDETWDADFVTVDSNKSKCVHIS